MTQQTKRFSDFNIKPKPMALEGEKIKIDRVLNRELTVHKFQIKPSKFTDKGTGQCLHIQVELGGEKRVIFTGSGTLMDLLEQVPKEEFPFMATIVKENDRYELR